MYCRPKIVLKHLEIYTFLYRYIAYSCLAPIVSLFDLRLRIESFLSLMEFLMELPLIKCTQWCTGDYRDLRLPPSIYQQAVTLLRNNPEFTMAASLRQEELNSGTILAFSHGFNRYAHSQFSLEKCVTFILYWNPINCYKFITPC